MKKSFLSVLVLMVMTGVAVAGAVNALTSGVPRIVVTTTLIETAVRDLAGDDVEVVRLLPPGSCPGHFDLEPGQVAAVAAASLFVRHDYQAGLDAGVQRAGFNTNGLVSLGSFPAFTIPASYVALCTELNSRLAREWPERAAALDQRLRQIENRASDVEKDIRLRAKRVHGRRVLCARYQKDFCEWFGLSVVATFNAGTDESAWQLNRAVDMGKQAGAEAVVGNAQWGSKHLRALAEATGLPGIMLSNFPDGGEGGAYWRLVEGNVDALLKGFSESGH